MTTGDDRDLPDAVAVIGLACRFPGADDSGAFWANLRDGRESIAFPTPEELTERGVPARRLADPAFVAAGGVLEDPALFDAEYFGITPREADLMDPQHRLFLQCAVTAFEDAGLDPDRYDGEVGVYAACGFNSYLTHHLLPHAAQLADRADVQWLAGGDKDYLATQVSYRLGLTGPSLSVQSACSSALVAVHLACESLLSAECDAALVGAVSVGMAQGTGYLHSEGGILSADGHCRPFDAEATGTVFGSGVGAVVLKRLADAVADGDTVRAVLRGSAVNNDGNRKVGFTAPGVDGQVRVIRSALDVAGVDPAQISCVETHGTGTALGDQIELTALARVFGDAAGERVLGAVKSNVGHLDTCAGMAGLIKTVLALEHRTLPPTVHFTRPHPGHGIGDGRFRIATRAEPWPGTDGERLAGVSSFGIGGTNAHVVVQEAPVLPEPEPAPRPAGRWEILPLSARTPGALERAAARMAPAARELSADRLPDMAYSLQTGRRAHGWRRAVLAATPEGAATALAAPAEAVPTRADGAGAVFLLPGQGVGRQGLAADAYRDEPVFRAALDTCLEALQPWLDTPLRPLLLTAGPAETDAFARTETAQPALFAVQYALTAWWTALGVRPGALVGHSLGELTAACVAGVFSLADTARLVAERGRLMSRLPHGRMLAVPLPPDRVAELLVPGVGIAAVNAPDRCVVSGDPEPVEELAARLTASGIPVRWLATRHAFHSHHLDPLLDAYAALVAGLPAHDPALPVVSTLTGAPLTAEQARSPRHWVRQLREPVRFADALAHVPAGPLLDIGPGRTLASAARRTLGTARTVLSGFTGTETAQQPPDRLAALAALWEGGAAVHWPALGDRPGPRRVPLPAYSFEPVRHWYEPDPRQPAHHPADPAVPTRSDDGITAPHWTRSLPPTPEPPQPQTVLVLADTGGLAPALTERLTADGLRVVTAHAAGPSHPAGALHESADGYLLRPDDRDAVHRLVTVLAERGLPPDTVVGLWTADHPALADADPGEAALAAAQAVAAPVFLARALGEIRPGHPVRMLFVTDTAHAVGGHPPRTPHSAAVLGPVRVIPAETPALTLRCLDITRSGPAASAAGAIRRELHAPGAWTRPEPLVALRGRDRWVPALHRPELAPPSAGPTVRAGGTYLITGGLGGLGGAIAGHFAAQAACTLVLLSRREIPGTDGFTVVRPGTPPAGLPAELADRLAALTAHGATVCLVSADVADADALGHAVDRVHDTFGRIAGVVHAAGVPGGGMTALRTRQEIDDVLAPKVLGTLLLSRLTEPDAPDFLLLCSSVLARVGVAGQCDYTAANAFLDSFAATADHAVSVGWDRWTETGMALAGVADPNPDPDASWSGARPLDHPLFDACRTGTGASGDPLPAGTREFRVRHSPDTAWAAEEHRIDGVPVLPGTALVELALAAHRATGEQGPVVLRDVVLTRPLVLGAGPRPRIAVRLEPRDDGHRWTVTSSASPHRPHAEGHVAAFTGPQPPAADPAEAPAGRTPTSREPAGSSGAAGLVTGPRWDCLAEAWQSPDGGVLRLRLPESFHADLRSHPLHPALLDVATGAVVARTGGHLPVAYRSLTSYRDMPADVHVHVRLHGEVRPDATVVLDALITDTDGRPVVTAEGFVLRPAPSGPSRPPHGDHGGLTTAQGLAALDRVLANSHLPHVLVSHRTAPPGAAEAPAAPQAAAAQPAPHTPSRTPAGGPPADALEERLAQVWSRLLGISPIGRDDSVFDLGGDSLLVVQIAAQTQQAGLAVSPGDIFENPTVARLAERLRTRQPPPAPTDPPPTEDPSPPSGAPAEPFPDAELSDDDLALVLSRFRPQREKQ